MAQRTPKPVEGETRFGKRTRGGQGTLYVQSNTNDGLTVDANYSGKGSVLAVDAIASDGTITTVYLWASSDGKWRTGTTYPTDTESGTVVGTQS